MTLRIVHVVCSDRFAGTERHVATLAAAQAAAGDAVAVVGGDDRLRDHAPGVVQLPAAGVAGAVRALVRLGRADVLHAHMTDAEVAVALLPGRRRALRVATRHFARPRGSSPLRRGVSRATALRLDGQLAISEFVARNIDGPSTVVHPGVPEVAGASPSRAGRSPVVLLAQRLEAEKATDTGLRAFAASGLAAAGWRLQVAGEGSQRAALGDLARTLGIGAAVDFLGHRGDVAELMRRASALLAPCPVEGLGLTVLEAMATGLPVVASAAGGHLETVGSVPGAALFPRGDHGAAGAQLARLADPAAAEAYGGLLLARQREAFAVDGWRRATDAFYRSLR